jgi:NAD(P)H-flavin reductase
MNDVTLKELSYQLELKQYEYVHFKLLEVQEVSCGKRPIVQMVFPVPYLRVLPGQHVMLMMVDMATNEVVERPYDVVSSDDDALHNLLKLQIRVCMSPCGVPSVVLVV